MLTGDVYKSFLTTKELVFHDRSK